MSAATWPTPNVRRGFRRLYLILAVLWLVVFAIGFAIQANNYVDDDAEYNRLAAKITAMQGKPDDPAYDDKMALRDLDAILDANKRRIDAENGMINSFALGIGTPLPIFLIWRALIWIGSGFQRNEARQ
jgi:hypothetical protein